MSDEQENQPEASSGASAGKAAGREPSGGSPSVAGRGGEMHLGTLLKVPVSLSIEVGRKKMPLNQLLETHEGSVIELERLLDEPLDILVNGALIAHGVVVLANDRFGIQITDIVSLEERVRTI